MKENESSVEEVPEVVEECALCAASTTTLIAICSQLQDMCLALCLYCFLFFFVFLQQTKISQV